MGKLIDRTAVMEYLRQEQANEIIDNHEDDFVVNSTLDMINAFINFVVCIPSIEEGIIAEIEEEIRESKEFFKDSDEDFEVMYRKGLRKAIKIIREGEWSNE